VKAYDIYFRPAGSSWKHGYNTMNVDSPATSVLITRENGFNPLTKYDFKVRARNDGRNGTWSRLKSTGTYVLHVC